MLAVEGEVNGLPAVAEQLALQPYLECGAIHQVKGCLCTAELYIETHIGQAYEE